MKLKDLVAIITGAGRNIGEDTAKLFAAEGAKVAVNGAASHGTAHRADTKSLAPLVLTADVSDGAADMQLGQCIKAVRQESFVERRSDLSHPNGVKIVEDAGVDSRPVMHGHVRSL